MNDLLGTPKEFEYVYSEKFRECFLYNIGFKLEMFDMPACFKSKFYKYLDLYKIHLNIEKAPGCFAYTHFLLSKGTNSS